MYNVNYMKKISQFLKTTEGMFVGGLVLIIVLLMAYYFYAINNEASTTNTTTITVSEKDHVRGAQGAKVTVVEFGDFQCPACGAYEPLVRELLKNNADTMQLVFRHFPLTQLHPNALLAAKASEAAGAQGKFWEMHDMLYDKQAEWSGALNARDFFMTYATNLSLDLTQFTQSIDSKEVEDKVLAEYKEGVKLGVQGTPTFFINGEKITNPQSIDAFDAVIKEAAKQAGTQ